MQFESAKGKNIRTQMSLDDLPNFLRLQCPNLIPGIVRYDKGREFNVTKKLENFKQLKKTEKMEALGWIYGGAMNLKNECGFYVAMGYFNLSSIRGLETIFKNEFLTSTNEEIEAFEKGYRHVTLNN